MNQFSEELLRARARQRRIYIGIVATVGTVFIVLFIIFVLLRVLTVNVLPDDARQAADIDLQQGVGFIVGKKVYAFSSELVLHVSAEGFASESVPLKADIGSVQIELTELPARLLAKTNAGHDEIRWLVNNELTAVGAELQVELAPGEHSLTVDSPYHESQVIQLDLQRAEEKQLAIELKPVAGHMTIESVPTGMPVRIDGELKGVTPLSGEYPGGRYSVEIETPEYQTVSDDIAITSSSPQASRNYRLQLKKAWLDVEVMPTGGDLLVNGRKVDPASQVGIQSSVSNTITYLKAGHYPQTREITLQPEEKQKLSIKLKAEKGRVEIRSKPVAEVFIDGKPHGSTPLNISLQAVRHKVSLKKQGYRSVTKTVTPSSKKTVSLDVTLQDEQSARLAESRKLYTNSIGMELKLFIPSRFTMGAARHEKGQRANEFVRDVDLQRPFYAALKEVTVNQYSKFRNVTTSTYTGDYPVTAISWLQAAEFCNWLSNREKLKPFYNIKGGQLVGVNKTADGYRLPSEAEWEWLARKAGRKQQTQFTWGNDTVVPPASGNIADESARNAVSIFIANYNDGYEKLAPVGSFPPDNAGLHDLTGNVSEWVHDYYSLLPPTAKAVEVDPLGDDTGTNHVIKGSSWRSGTLTELRASFREGAVDGREDTGFRVARYLYGG